MSIAPPISRISVIIPARNEAATLPATLMALAQEAVHEVIVADGKSVDRTVDVARQFGATVVTGPAGRGRQQNAGATLASGEILLFLHADTLMPPNFAAEVRAVLADPAVAVGAFRLGIAGHHPGLRLIEFFANLRARFCGLPYGDQALFLRAADFRAVGGFRDLPLLEDVELVRRMRQKGRIRLAPGAVRTSARRWQQLGLLRTTLRNLGIMLGFLLGVAPHRLDRWYRRGNNG
jgi:rSAM/selenodomain-associated transferase 2